MNSAAVRHHDGNAPRRSRRTLRLPTTGSLALRGQLRELATAAGQVPDRSTLVIPSRAKSPAGLAVHGR
jgi:hypothetical protein